jgi:hypothetical protein
MLAAVFRNTQRQQKTLDRGSGLIPMAIPPSHNDNEPEVWSERDLLVLYNELSLGASIQDIAARFNRNVEEVREKVASLKEKPKKE